MIVLILPGGGLAPYVLQRGEPLHVQAFVARRPVEALDKPVPSPKQTRPSARVRKISCITKARLHLAPCSCYCWPTSIEGHSGPVRPIITHLSLLMTMPTMVPPGDPRLMVPSELIVYVVTREKFSP